MTKGGPKSYRRGKRSKVTPWQPFEGLRVSADRSFPSGRPVWVAQYGSGFSGYSDSCPLRACAEAMHHAAGRWKDDSHDQRGTV